MGNSTSHLTNMAGHIGKQLDRRWMREVGMLCGSLDARLRAGPGHRRQGLCEHFDREELGQIHALGKLICLKWRMDGSGEMVRSSCI